MGAVVGGARIARRRGSALKGKKVPPKYRSPSGETWAGRGVKPRWHPLLGACTEEISHEGLVSHRSALRGRNVRHHPVSPQVTPRGLELSVDQVQAYYGHYRRVHRRVYRRAYRRGYYHGYY